MQRGVWISCRSGDRIDDRIQKRPEVGILGRHRSACNGAPVASDRRDDRKFNVLIRGFEVEEQLVYLVDDLVDSGILAIDLVDDDDGR